MRPILRLGGATVGLTLMVTGIVLIDSAQHEVREFRRAHHCTAAGDDRDCIARSAGTVVDRDSVFQAPPAPARDHVTVRSPDGHEETFEDVSPDLYDLAKKGRAVQLEIWRGHIIRMAIGGHHASNPFPEGNEIEAWLLGWVGMALATACIGFRRQGWPFWLGFSGGLFPYAALGWWSQAWYVVPLIVVAIMAIVRIRTHEDLPP